MTNEVQTNAPGSGANNVNVIVQERKSNGLGTAGFVLALLAILLCWIPILDWILWVLGAVFSFAGVFRAPRGLAITGLVLSFIGVIILLVLVAAIASVF